MNQNLRLFLVLTASLISFFIYCTMWIDWVQDVMNGTYLHNYLEAMLETVVLAGYTYLAIRFAYSRLNLF
ncbi:hypothetical protein [Fibrella arboris]|uniref:hypothetical protein n=1 Tax=Fibrella arboris TaxID=3242486 RepID=UPI003522195B